MYLRNLWTSPDMIPRAFFKNPNTPMIRDIRRYNIIHTLYTKKKTAWRYFTIIEEFGRKRAL